MPLFPLNCDGGMSGGALARVIASVAADERESMALIDASSSGFMLCTFLLFSCFRFWMLVVPSFTSDKTVSRL